jgi:hypothetical protein
MQNARSRFQRPERNEAAKTNGEQVEAGSALNGRWTGYQPALARIMSQARLEALRETQRGGGRDE